MIRACALFTDALGSIPENQHALAKADHVNPLPSSAIGPSVGLSRRMTTAARFACALAALWLLHAASIPSRAQALSKLSLVLNFAADGNAAGFYHALERGYFREVGLDVTIEPSKGSADAITRTATQASDMGIGDISTLVEFTSRRPEVAPKAVFILHNRSPQAVIALRSSGITKLSDLHGRVLGQGPADAPSRIFPAVANLAGLDLRRIEIRQFSPQLRDSMLITKKVDAVTGFDSTVLFNLKANGVPIDEATVIYYADNGLDVYGNAILANPAFLQARPDAVKAFVLAAARGWRDAIADPQAAMVSLGRHNNLAKLDIEAERLAWVGSHQIVTPVTRKEGIGAYDRQHLATNVAQVAKAFELARTPTVADIYDDRFLPPREARIPSN
jgi:NitT/TauT family transport system substrate-binding protein